MRNRSTRRIIKEYFRLTYSKTQTILGIRMTAIQINLIMQLIMKQFITISINSGSKKQGQTGTQKTKYYEDTPQAIYNITT